MLIFRWNESNERHIAKHGVEPEEAEEVVKSARPPFPEKRPDGKYRVWGQTQAGRYLQVIYVHDEDDPDGVESGANVAIEDLSLVDLVHLADGALAVYVIHARDLEPHEKHQYRKRTRS